MKNILSKFFSLYICHDYKLNTIIKVKLLGINVATFRVNKATYEVEKI